MKTLFQITILYLTISFTAFSQIPNSGFENWTNGNPDGWTTDNDPADGFVFIKPTMDSHTGTYALKAQVLSDKGYTINPVLAIVFPFSQRPTNFSGYYKFTSAGSDSLRIIVSLGSSRDSAGAGGGGSLVVKNSVNNYTQFNIPIYWASKNPPDSCVISFTVYPDPPYSHSGTVYFLDDLAFSNGTTGIERNRKDHPYGFELSQNYPNPFNPTTVISYSIPSGETQNFASVQLKVYDMLGRVAATLVNKEQTPGNYKVQFNGSSLPSGVYLYRLTCNNFTKSKSMILLK
jgi:Secretion system C-terminal sorting domain